MSDATTRAESARIAELKAELTALKKLGEPLEAPDPVAVIDARISRLVDIYDRDWDTFDVEAAVQFAKSATALRDARAVSVVKYGERI